MLCHNVSLQEHSYIVDSFEEFEALARRALHEDLHTGAFLVQGNRSTCDRLCKEQADCCHPKAECNCGTHTVPFTLYFKNTVIVFKAIWKINCI